LVAAATAAPATAARWLDVLGDLLAPLHGLRAPLFFGA
jgi:hypothetical protein